MCPFRRRPSTICPSSSNVSLVLLLLPSLLLPLLVSFAEGGTWLSFNQNNGGIDGGLIRSALRGKYTAGTMSGGRQLALREGEQLISLLRMCRQKTLKRSQHNLDELCSALFQMAKEQRRRKRRDIFGREGLSSQMSAESPFLPIGMDDEQLLWW